MRSSNLAALARQPAIVSWLQEAPSIERVEEVNTRSGLVLRLNGVTLQGRVDPASEARLQARLAPLDAPRVTVYGLGLGALPRELLQRASLRELRVVILNPSVARTVLERSDQSDWLCDARVTLVAGERERALELPFCALPAHLRLAADAALPLRDRVRMELDRPFQSRHHRGQAERHAERLEENRAHVAQDGDVGSLFRTCPGATVHVAAAGPSLFEGLELRNSSPGPLIAVDAALRPLLAREVRPDIVVALDMHAQGLRELFNVPAEALAGVTLVYFPSVTGEVLAGFPGRRLVAYTARQATSELAREHPRATLFSSGSVLHPAVDLAVRMGARRVVLHGADFAHLDGVSHVHEAAFQTRAAAPGAQAQVLDGRGERVPSLANLVGYLRDLEDYIAAAGADVSFSRASARGAMIRGTSLHEETHVH